MHVKLNTSLTELTEFDIIMFITQTKSDVIMYDGFFGISPCFDQFKDYSLYSKLSEQIGPIKSLEWDIGVQTGIKDALIGYIVINQKPEKAYYKAQNGHDISSDLRAMGFIKGAPIMDRNDPIDFRGKPKDISFKLPLGRLVAGSKLTDGVYIYDGYPNDYQRSYVSLISLGLEVDFEIMKYLKVNFIDLICSDYREFIQFDHQCSGLDSQIDGFPELVFAIKDNQKFRFNN